MLYVLSCRNLKRTLEPHWAENQQRTQEETSPPSVCRGKHHQTSLKQNWTKTEPGSRGSTGFALINLLESPSFSSGNHSIGIKVAGTNSNQWVEIRQQFSVWTSVCGLVFVFLFWMFAQAADWMSCFVGRTRRSRKYFLFQRTDNNWYL